MKHVITVQVPATSREEIERETCDLCGAPARGGSRPSAVDYVVVKRVTGTFYNREDAWAKSRSYDVCVACYETKIERLFKEAGAAPYVEELDADEVW